MNKAIMQGKRRRVRGNLKVTLARITDNDRRMLDGKIDQMTGMLQERYGYTQQGAAKALAHYLGGYGKKKRGHAAGSASKWPRMLSAVGLAGLITAGWFVLTRVLSARQKMTPAAEMTREPFANPDFVFD